MTNAGVQIGPDEAGIHDSGESFYQWQRAVKRGNRLHPPEDLALLMILPFIKVSQSITWPIALARSSSINGLAKAREIPWSLWFAMIGSLQ